MNKININNRNFSVPEDNVLDLRKIYKENNLEPEEVGAKKEVKKVKKKKQRSFKNWLEARRVKKQEKALLKEQLRKERKEKKNKVKDQPKKATEPKVEKVKFKRTGLVRELIKPLVGFALICVILVLPMASSAFYQKMVGVKDRVLDNTVTALVDLKSGGVKTMASDYDQAQMDFQSAVEQFQAAQGELSQVNKAVTTLAKALPGAQGEQLKSAENLLVAGENISGAATDFNKALNILGNLNVQELSEGEDQVGITTGIMVLHSALRPAATKITKANEALQEVSLEVVPEENKEQVALAQELLPKVDKDLQKFLSMAETFLDILGHQEKKRYLVLFQNNHELRATGGFIGSLAIIDLYKGRIEKLDIPGGGSYDVSGQLDEKIAAPEPLQLVNPHWYLQDANWWPDFPTSAEKVEWFYEHSGGTTIDGIITFTPEVFEKLLEVTGPIDFTEQYGTEISAENFYEVVQTEAEKKYDETQESKKIIADLTPVLLDKVFSLQGTELFEVMNIFHQSFKEKDILFYFNDPELEADVVARGWGGDVIETDKDYLSVVNTNIAGGKSDAAIEETITQEVQINNDGTVTDKLKITRQHKAESDDVFADVNNWDYLRVYVPEGSQLTKAEGFTYPQKDLFLEPEAGYLPDSEVGEPEETDFKNVYELEELNKTVFSGWVETPVGGSSQIVLEYDLPFKVEAAGSFTGTDTYSLLVQKQAGSFDSLYLNKLTLPDNLEILWQSSEGLTEGTSQALTTDRFWGMVLKEK